MVPQRPSDPCPCILKAIFLSTSDGITRMQRQAKWLGEVNKKCIIQGAPPEGQLMEELG